MEESLGTVTVSPEVLIQLVQLTALTTPGVARLSRDHPNSVQRLFSGKASEGIRLALADDAVSLDLYVVADPDTHLLTLGQTLQREVGRAIQDVVGMPVQEINIHIQDIADRVVSAVEQD
ncbi:MAG: Asp23/Gls24 family envelope stress response protein [Chloroflexi bacterium]|nr:Asp23/Gls24 family envelope stress response protein [Chloroflexota bacterium]